MRKTGPVRGRLRSKRSMGSASTSGLARPQPRRFGSRIAGGRLARPRPLRFSSRIAAGRLARRQCRPLGSRSTAAGRLACRQPRPLGGRSAAAGGLARPQPRRLSGRWRLCWRRDRHTISAAHGRRRRSRAPGTSAGRVRLAASMRQPWSSRLWYGASWHWIRHSSSGEGDRASAGGLLRLEFLHRLRCSGNSVGFRVLRLQVLHKLRCSGSTMHDQSRRTLRCCCTLDGRIGAGGPVSPRLLSLRNDCCGDCICRRSCAGVRTRTCGRLGRGPTAGGLVRPQLLRWHSRYGGSICRWDSVSSPTSRSPRRTAHSLLGIRVHASRARRWGRHDRRGPL